MKKKPTEGTVQWFEVFLGEIKPVRVSHETEKTVTVIGKHGNARRHNKKGESWNFFPTKAQAALFIETQLIEEKSRAIERLAEAEVRLHEFRRKYQKELAAT